jgi:pullulanase
MGIYDLDTMKMIRAEMNSLDPGILLYGEGWTADKSPMQEQKRAVKINTSLMPGIAGFNDDFRDAMKGNNGNKKSKGFVSGLDLREEAIKFGVVGAVNHPQIVYNYVETSMQGWAAEPDQCINYASCHDNYTLWDKLKFSCSKASDEELKKMVKLAGALVLTSQGVPFLHSGVEFCRSKKGNGNSYKSPDTINQLNWPRKKEFYDIFQYYKQLIQLRKNHPAFRINSAEQIRKFLHFCTQYKTGVVSYCIDGEEVGDSWGKIILLFNGNRNENFIPLPEGNYQLMANGKEISENGFGITISDVVKVPAISMIILSKIK